MNKKIWFISLMSLSLLTLTACSSTDSNTKGSSSSKEVKTAQSSTMKSSDSGISNSLQLAVKAAQSQIPTLKEQYGSVYSDIKITAEKPETLVYTYTFAEEPQSKIDGEALKPVLAEGLKTTVNTLKPSIPSIQVKVIYLGPDKKELVNVVITQEDIDKISSQSSEEKVE